VLLVRKKPSFQGDRLRLDLVKETETEGAFQALAKSEVSKCFREHLLTAVAWKYVEHPHSVRNQKKEFD